MQIEEQIAAAREAAKCEKLSPWQRAALARANAKAERRLAAERRQEAERQEAAEAVAAIVVERLGEVAALLDKAFLPRDRDALRRVVPVAAAAARFAGRGEDGLAGFEDLGEISALLSPPTNQR